MTRSRAHSMRSCDRRLRALSLLEAEASELLLEAGDPPGAIHDLLLAAGPRRVRLRVDVETQRVTLLAPGGAGGELGAVRHDDLDGVVFGMSVGLHGESSRPGPLHKLAKSELARGLHISQRLTPCEAAAL